MAETPHPGPQSGYDPQKIEAKWQKRWEDARVFETDVDAVAAYRDCDLLVASDGINSRVRATYADAFRPNLDRRLCRFVWLGTTLPLDAFTFIFEETEHGWFTVHAYRFDADWVDTKVTALPRYVGELMNERADALLKDLDAGFTARGRVESLLTPLLA